MQWIHSEYMWLSQHVEISLTELAGMAGVDEAEVHMWMEEGIITPTNPGAKSLMFGADRVTTVVKACRLRRDFELEPHGLGLIVQLLEHIQRLEGDISELRAKQPGICCGSEDDAT